MLREGEQRRRSSAPRVVDFRPSRLQWSVDADVEKRRGHVSHGDEITNLLTGGHWIIGTGHRRRAKRRPEVARVLAVAERMKYAKVSHLQRTLFSKAIRGNKASRL